MTEQSSTTIPPMPEPLAPNTWHSRAQIRAHQAAMEAHVTALNAARRAQERQAARAKQGQVLSDEEHDEFTLNRFNEQRGKQLQREADELARLSDRRDSNPSIAEVMVTTFAALLQEVTHWASKGYTLHLEGPQVALPHLYHCQLMKPAKASKAVH